MKNVLRQHVLVLNRFWQVVNESTVQEALGKMAAGAFTAISYDDGLHRPVDWEEWLTLKVREGDLEVHSKYLTVRAPRTVIACNYEKIPKTARKLTNRAIGERDKFICQYTGLHAPDGNVDHVDPKNHPDPKKRGGTTWENLAWSSRKINDMKGARTPEEAGLKRPKPGKPLVAPILVQLSPRSDVPEWDAFLIHKH